MRSAERELAEMERKKQAAEAMNANNARPRTLVDLNKERLVELTHQIGLEVKRLANTRVQLSKVKNSGNSISSANGVMSSPALPTTAIIKSKESTSISMKKSGSSAVSAANSENVVEKNGRALTVPDGLLPELCK